MKQKLLSAKTRVQNFIMTRQCGVRGEREEGSHLVEVLGTIIIAVVILIFFRGMIVNLFRNMMENTNTKVSDLFQNVTS